MNLLRRFLLRLIAVLLAILLLNVVHFNIICRGIIKRIEVVSGIRNIVNIKVILLLRLLHLLLGRFLILLRRFLVFLGRIRLFGWCIGLGLFHGGAQLGLGPLSIAVLSGIDGAFYSSHDY